MKRFNKAFTLAEVLITLGIIGIVAAMTIPTLMKNTQDIELKSAWKKAYSAFAQAAISVKNDNGGTFAGVAPAPDTAGQNTFRDAYLQYLKAIKTCNSNTGFVYGVCFHPLSGFYLDTVKLLNGTSHIQVNSYDPYFALGSAGAILSDGQMVLFAYQSADCTYAIEGYTNGCGYITIDVNGFKGPNTVGRDIYSIVVLQDRVLPAGTRNLATNCTPASDGRGCAAQYLGQ